jgi:hypothetical protein
MELTQPLSKWWLGVLSADVTQPVCASDHSRLFSANVENEWSYISTLNILYSFTFKFTFTTNDIIKLRICVREPYMEP